MAKNINKIKIPNKHQLSVDEYLNGITAGNRTILSKAITLIESSNQKHQEIADDLIEKCLPYSGKSTRIGITGVPGVGKSTFIEAVGSYLIAEKGKKIAVLAIDPSSKKSGGSILGDKTRMNELSVNNNAFVRPSPSAGTLGGVARATRESIILCEAAGFDTILIETVGVGQSEIEVKSMVDFFLLLMLAGAGDELQGIKRGIMEIADAVIINKADGDNLEKAKLASREYKNAIHLFPPNSNNWTPQVDICSSINQKGIENVWKIIESFKNLTVSNGSFNKNRSEQAKFWLEQTINDDLKNLFYQDSKIKTRLNELEILVTTGSMSPFKAAKELISLFKNQ